MAHTDTFIEFDFDFDYADDVYADVADLVIDTLDAFFDGDADVVDVFTAQGFM